MALIAAAFSTGAAHAASVAIFQGSDPSVGPGGVHPTADAAAAAFGAATIFLNTVDFEGILPIGFVNTATIAPGVSISTTNLSTSLSGLSTDNTHQTLGFNTTAGGNEFFRFVNSGGLGSVDFNFTTAVNAWGAYFTGIEATSGAAVHVTFSDGTFEDFSIARNSLAGVTFFGFTDVGATITTISISENITGLGTRDIFGIDDVAYQTVLVATGPADPPIATPLPAAAWGGAALLAGLGASRLRRRK